MLERPHWPIHRVGFALLLCEVEVEERARLLPAALKRAGCAARSAAHCLCPASQGRSCSCDDSPACAGSSWTAAAFPAGTVQCPSKEHCSVQCHCGAHGLGEKSSEQRVEDTERAESLSGDCLRITTRVNLKCVH